MRGCFLFCLEKLQTFSSVCKLCITKLFPENKLDSRHRDPRKANQIIQEVLTAVDSRFPYAISDVSFHE